MSSPEGRKRFDIAAMRNGGCPYNLGCQDGNMDNCVIIRQLESQAKTGGFLKPVSEITEDNPPNGQCMRLADFEGLVVDSVALAETMGCPNTEMIQEIGHNILNVKKEAGELF